MIFGTFSALLAYFIYIDAFDYVVAVSAAHENWELDEILTAMMVLPIGMAIFSIRRLSETSVELQKRIEAEEQARTMALHDPLTGLPNRRKLTEILDKNIANSLISPLALVVIDLNRFKNINDLYGHRTGDQLLIKTAQRLTAAVGQRATISRPGGDEFVVVLPDASQNEALIRRVMAISACFDQPFDLDAGAVMVGASIGVTCIVTPDLSTDDAISQADAAMYVSKYKGQNAFHFFEAGMELAALRRAEIETSLSKAIAEGRIEPHYQPLVNLSDGQIIGYEVLARWRLQDGKLRLPDEFIRIAEDTGLIRDLFYSLLEKSAIEVRSWPADLTFAINLSPVQFGDHWLVEKVLQILGRAGVAPGRLEIEITENALVSDVDQARSVIENFKSQGIRVALDDFGTGYSSLRHLSEMKFDMLKIDGSFIKDLSINSTSQTIVRTMTSLAHSLGLGVTVEGIETKESEKDVISYGCDLGQGYLYGRPDRQILSSIKDGSSERAA